VGFFFFFFFSLLPFSFFVNSRIAFVIDIFVANFVERDLHVEVLKLRI
jgi:hypothetical protein